MRYRRITAAIFDIFIIAFIVSAVFSFIPLNSEVESKYNEILKIESNYKNYQGMSETDFDKISELSYEIERLMVKYYLIFSLIWIIYFIIIPIKFKNQTIGQRFRKVRLVSEKEITINTFVFRAIINSGLALLIFFPLFLYIFDRVWYSIFTTFLLLIQIVYWVVSTIMLLVKKETIHDKLTNTKIIEVKR